MAKSRKSLTPMTVEELPVDPSIELMPPTITMGHESADRRTHIERINPGDNPAYVWGQGVTHP
jgi:hypothetical protein